MSYHPPQHDGQPPPDHPRATPALLLGLVGLVCCSVVGVPAYLIGRDAEREIVASGGRLGGEGKARAGKILGLVAIAVMVLSVLVWVWLLFDGSPSVTFDVDTEGAGDS